MALMVDIRKKLGDFQLDVQFESEDGILALLGASGCGKSMTLKCIAGIETPDEGQIILDGRVLFDGAKRVNLSPQKRRVGYLFQNYALFPNMTVAQNIAMGVREKAARQSTVAAMCQALYLTGMEHKLPHQLSGGQQQRVALARILANQPDILMLDEPFSALDSYLRWQVELELVDTLKTYDKTTLFVSHSRDEVYRICDRVCLINEGQSEPVMPVKDLFDSPGTLSVALLSGCKNYSRIRRLDESHIEAVDWGITLTCAGMPQADTQYLGVRAHFVHPADMPGENTFECNILRVVDDVFSTVVMVRPQNAAQGSQYADIRLELAKDAWQALGARNELLVHIAPEDILLLR